MLRVKIIYIGGAISEWPHRGAPDKIPTGVRYEGQFAIVEFEDYEIALPAAGISKVSIDKDYRPRVTTHPGDLDAD
jgi:hypothetical protein